MICITGEAISQELLQLVTASADDESETAIEKIKFLIQEGADPNYASKETSETILHKVAANWGTDLADLIVKNVMNIDVRDKYGRTPLHAAACSNNSDMVQWLIANVELKTRNECQTPLHYAARFDSIEAIKILLHARGKIQNSVKLSALYYWGLETIKVTNLYLWNSLELFSLVLLVLWLYLGLLNQVYLLN